MGFDEQLETIIILVIVALAALIVTLLLFQLATLILTPLIVGGVAALAVAQIAGWGSVELREEDGGYTLIVRVSRPVEFLLAWLLLALLTAAVIRW